MMRRVLLALLLSTLAVGCTSHASAALAVDTPLVPYQAPDIDELTGDDMVDDSEAVDEVDRVDAAGSDLAAPEAVQETSKPPAAPAKSGK